MAKPLVEVAIGADGSVFVREVDKATGASEKFGASVKKSGDTAKGAAKAFDGFAADVSQASNTAAKWVAGIAAAAAAAGVALVKSAIDSADATGVLAGKLGITTEALSKLQYAAKLSDVSQGALESGLRKLSTTLVSAVDPASKAAKALSAIGLSASELIDLPADEQLARIGEALSRVENSSVKAALAQKLFGKSGQDLLPLLAEGGDGIRRLSDEAENLGLVVSGDTARSAMEFNDNLDKLKSSVQGLGMSVAKEVLPQLVDFTTKLTDLAKNKETAEGIATFIRGIGDAIIWTTQGIANTGNFFQFLGEEIAALVGGPAIGDIERIDDAIARLKQKLDPQGSQLNIQAAISAFMSDEERQKILDDIARLEQWKRVSRELAEMQARTQKDLAKSASDAQPPVRSLETDVNQLSEALGIETDAQKAARLAREAAAKSAENQRIKIASAIDQLRFEVTQLNRNEREQRIAIALRNAGATAASAEGQEIARLTGELYDHEVAVKKAEEATRKHEEAMKKAAEQSDPWAEALEGAVQRVDSAFVDMWKNIGSGFDSFADSLKDAFKQLLAELANLAITRPILMRIGAAFGLGGGSSGALASAGGGLSSLSSLGSAFGTIKSALGIGGGGGFLGGASGLGTQLYSVMGDLAGKLGLDSLSSAAFEQWKNFRFGSGMGNLANAGLNIGAGMAGNFAGNALGQSLFGERKTTGIGGGVGGVIGSAWGPIGSAIGSFLGSLAENAIGKIFGTGDLVRWGKLGITTGKDIPTDGSALETITGASGLTLSAVAKRTDADAAKQLLEGFNAIDSALTAAARAAGMTVDFTNTVLGNTSLNVDNQGPKNSFGVGARLDEFSADKIKGSADEFARAWLAEIDDQISARIKTVLGDTSKKTADQIVALFGAASDLDRLLKIDVLKATADAAEDAAKTILDVYDTATQKVVDLASEYDGTAESLNTLTSALAEQKAIAVQLAEQYRQVSLAVTAQFGDAIGQIQDSLLNEADLYAKRREQIAALTTELATTIDPLRIAAISDQINQLALNAYGLLDEGQRAAMGAEFVAFLENARDLATAQLQAGTDSLGTRESGVAGAIDLELVAQAAQIQQEAANTFAGAVETFAGLMSGNVFGIDPEQIIAYLRAQGIEVNV